MPTATPRRSRVRLVDGSRRANSLALAEQLRQTALANLAQQRGPTPRRKNR
jgi:hypothetical protein